MQTLKREGEPRLLLESAGLGVAGALCARLFMWMLELANRFLLNRIAGYQPPGLEAGHNLVQHIGAHGLWLVPLVTTLGGLLSGLLVYRFAPEAEGHGTDTAVNAFHREDGIIRPRVAPIKMIASAITIGSGGAAGREGPIALITATIGSWYARLTRHTEDQRRLLLLAGMAAGLSAIFRSPMGTGVFAIEVLYGNMEFEVNALLYTMCSSAVAYAVNGLFVGFEPLFHIPAVATPRLRDYASYAILGLVAGVIGTLLPEAFYRTRDFFRSLPIPAWSKPAAGGLGLGLLALALPQVLQGGYGWIQLAIDAFALTVSSGGSGGVIAPSLFVGAMLGGSMAIVLHQPAAVFVVVGMAAVFGAAARVPIATMLMVTEMAGGFHLLVPAGMAVMIAYLMQDRLSGKLKYRSLPFATSATGSLGHIDLMRLLRSHVRFDLPGHKELTLAQVGGASPIAGKPLSALYQQLPGSDFEIVAITRREHVLLPHPDTILQPEDRVLLIAGASARSSLGEFLSPLPHPEPPASAPAHTNPTAEIVS
jgi:CIC family chloride channel protein